MSDWTESAQSVAHKIMTLLGHSQEPSNEPGDRLRDQVAVLVQQAVDARADTRETGLREAAEIARNMRPEEGPTRPGDVADAILAAVPSPPPPQSGEREIEAVVMTWPNGCPHPNSCSRHKRCQYRGCRYEADNSLGEKINVALNAMLTGEKPDV